MSYLQLTLVFAAASVALLSDDAETVFASSPYTSSRLRDDGATASKLEAALFVAHARHLFLPRRRRNGAGEGDGGRL